MKAVIDAVLKHIGPSKVKLDDFVDRLCYRYTPVLLGLFMFMTGTVDNFGSPISCMMPQEFSSTWTNHVHQYCYVTGTFIKVHNEQTGLLVRKVYVHYYQWVPYVLIILALIMRLPVCFWRFGQRMSDVEFCYVNEQGMKVRTAIKEKRDEHLSEIANYIHQIVVGRGRKHNGLGSLVSYIYLFYKCMNIVVVCAQIYMLNLFVGYSSWDWGMKLFRQAWSNMDWDKYSFFPRVAYCAFERDFLGQEVGGIREEVRCTLGINMLNEKVFLCLYYWYYSLVGLTVFNTICYAHQMLSPFRVSTLRTLLIRSNVSVNDAAAKANIIDGTVADEDVEVAGKTPQKRISNKFVNNVATIGKRANTWSSSNESHCSGSGDSPTNKSNRGKLRTLSVVRFMDECLGQDGLLLLRWVRQNAGERVASDLAATLYNLYLANK